MKPTEIVFAEPFDLKELIESIKLEGKVKERSRTYKGPHDIIQGLFDEYGEVYALMNCTRDKTLNTEDFDLKIFYCATEKSPIKKRIYFSLVGCSNRNIYYLCGMEMSKESKTIYEKTNIEGLLD